MRRIIFTLSILIFFSLANYAQLYFSVGYTGGIYTKGLPNFQNELYKLNNQYSANLTNRFGFTNVPKGICLEAGVSLGNDLYYFIRWSSMEIISDASGTNPANNTEKLNIMLNARLNQFAPFNFGYKLSDKLGVVVSLVDLDKFDVNYNSDQNIYNVSTFKANKWTDFYEKQLIEGVVAGTTLSVDYFITKKIGLRASYFIDWFGADKPKAPDFYRYNLNYLSLSLSYKIINK